MTKTVLLSRDTVEGEFTANIIKQVLLSKWGIKSIVIRVKFLGLIFEEGVTNLLDEIEKQVYEAKKNVCRIHINLTGGFKPESAMAYLVACLLNVDTVYYVHESMKTKSSLPIIPVFIRNDTVALIDKVRDKENCVDWIKILG